MIKKKLRKSKGETLVETLAAVLICVLAVLLLSGGITAASRVNLQNRRADEKYQTDLNRAEGYLESPVETEVVIDFGAEEVEIPVELFGGTGSFAAYRKGAVGP